MSRAGCGRTGTWSASSRPRPATAALLAADTADPAITGVIDAIAGADAVVVASPVYKAAYSGLLKALLDLLPQFALAGKAVLPLVTGGTPAHVLAIDYALRPVLTSLGADHVVQGWLVLDKHIAVDADRVALDAAGEGPVRTAVDGFSEAVHARRPLAVAL
ncbi:FMN reductase [Alloactinosynnema sp. L-07]|uniref:NAD(P)H-dependent oxidoreductase n=1 Tax=Alloactinosynnema sp. L-07 TaxID=1653480 RepID=UPI00065EEF9B|nr:NAD(P)H-dependent oxidoreductase [Alloactinosynnema sp. L-07]CRK57961.1 FMN reductase [Alloactinosynnema sp. L-07]